MNIECQFNIELDAGADQPLEVYAAGHAQYGFYFGIEVMFTFGYIYLLSLNYMLASALILTYNVGIGAIIFTRQQ